MIPRFDGAILSQEWKEALWDKFVTAARFMAFRPEAGRSLPVEKIGVLKAFTSKRGQLIETRKPLLAQIKAQGTLGSADLFAAMDDELKGVLERQITGIGEAERADHRLR